MNNSNTVLKAIIINSDNNAFSQLVLKTNLIEHNINRMLIKLPKGSGINILIIDPTIATKNT